MSQNVCLAALRWRQDGIDHVVKLLPGGRIGVLSDEILAEAAASGGKPGEKIAAIRAGDIARVRAIQRDEGPEGKEIATAPLCQWEESLPGPGGPVPVTFCRPGSPAVRPCLVYFHGGGWMYGSRAMVQPFCRYLAQEADALVVNVEYRLAPEHRWPAGFEDCWAVLCWVYSQAERLGVDPARITVGGDSAGGNMAALCAHRDRDQGRHMIRRQILYYAALSVRDVEGLSGFHFGLEDYIYDDSQKTMIEPRILAIYNASRRSEQNYLPRNVSSRDPRVSPLCDTDFSCLPETLLITAQYDYLTQQSRAYAGRLAAAGVPVTLMNYCGMAHAFVDKCGVYPQADDSLREVAAFLRKE